MSFVIKAFTESPLVTKLARKDWNIKFKKHLRMHQITLLKIKSPKIFWAFPDPTPCGQGDTPTPHPSRRLDARAFGAPYSAPLAPRLRLKDDLCFRLLLGPDTFPFIRTTIAKKSPFYVPRPSFFVCPGDAPAAFTQNVAWMKKTI